MNFSFCIYLLPLLTIDSSSIIHTPSRKTNHPLFLAALYYSLMKPSSYACSLILHACLHQINFSYDTGYPTMAASRNRPLEVSINFICFPTYKFDEKFPIYNSNYSNNPKIFFWGRILHLIFNFVAILPLGKKHL